MNERRALRRGPAGKAKRQQAGHVWRGQAAAGEKLLRHELLRDVAVSFERPVVLFPA